MRNKKHWVEIISTIHHSGPKSPFPEDPNEMTKNWPPCEQHTPTFAQVPWWYGMPRGPRLDMMAWHDSWFNMGLAPWWYDMALGPVWERHHDGITPLLVQAETGIVMVSHSSWSYLGQVQWSHDMTPGTITQRQGMPSGHSWDRYYVYDGMASSLGHIPWWYGMCCGPGWDR